MMMPLLNINVLMMLRAQVKNLERRTEEDVPYKDVAKHLAAAVPRLQHQGSSSAASGAARRAHESASFGSYDEADERPGFEDAARRGLRKFERR
jgi:hypothetical protein